MKIHTIWIAFLEESTSEILPKKKLSGDWQSYIDLTAHSMN
jgi:hypothetical protein